MALIWEKLENKEPTELEKPILLVQNSSNPPGLEEGPAKAVAL